MGEYRKLARSQGINTHPLEFNWSSVQILLAKSALAARITGDHKRAVRMQMISQNITQMTSATAHAQREFLEKIIKLAKQNLEHSRLGKILKSGQDHHVVQHGIIAATAVGKFKKPLTQAETPLSHDKSVTAHDVIAHNARFYYRSMSIKPRPRFFISNPPDDDSAGSCGSCFGWRRA